MPDDKPKRLCNVSPEHREKLHAFRADKYVSEWLATLHPLTRQTYESSLFALMEQMNITPTQLIDKVASDDRVTRRELSKQIKITLAQFKVRYSWQARNSMKAALQSLLDLNDLDLPLRGLKISGHRPVKPYMSWTDAERIISRAAIEYQPVFRFMLWSALDTARFVKLNCDSERIQAIKAQLRDQTKDWTKVWIPEGRKNCPPFGVFVPREIADLLPVLVTVT